MYAKFSGPSTKNLKSHHHVRLDAEFKADCDMWITFLHNTHLVVSRSFVDLSKVTEATVLNWYTDAAKGISLGFGGVFG